jgi:hypothetical protein
MINGLVRRDRYTHLSGKTHHGAIPGFELGRPAVDNVSLQRRRRIFGEAIEKRHRIGNDTWRQSHSARFGDCVGREHRSKHAEDDVEGALLVRQHFRIALVKSDCQPLPSGLKSRLIQQIGRYVDSSDHRTGSRRRYSEIACPTGHIENAHARSEITADDEVISARCNSFGNKAIISCHPGAPDASLKFVQIGDGFGQHRNASPGFALRPEAPRLCSI